MICLKCRCDAIRTKWCLTLRNIQSNTRTTINDDDCFNTTDIPKIDQMNCFILIKMSILTRYAGSGLLNPWLFQYFQATLQVICVVFIWLQNCDVDSTTAIQRKRLSLASHHSTCMQKRTCRALIGQFWKCSFRTHSHFIFCTKYLSCKNSIAQCKLALYIPYWTCGEFYSTLY